MEPWEKVFINNRSGDVGNIDSHLKIACVKCHGGDAKHPNNKELAHKELVRDPSEYKTVDGQLTNSCVGGGCHESLVKDKYSKSLHQNLWGERNMVAARSGAADFASCPQSTRDGFNDECTDCHATCGQCHVSIPNSAGGGFPKSGPIYSSHKFRKTPDMHNNCTACHGSRIAHDYYGDDEAGRKGDVHFKAGMTCLSQCHTKEEMHGAVAEDDQSSIDRYHFKELPQCVDCHTPKKGSNDYHLYHWDDESYSGLTCYACHSQPTYNNCTGCHVNGAWKTDPEYQEKNPEEDFRIGLNPLYDSFEDGDFRKVKFATLRHIPIARDSYDNWGSSLPDYDKTPTWKYTSPHNIQRFTAQTDTSGGKKCMASCHIYNDPANKNLFLFKAYVDSLWPDESNANKDVFVDDALPGYWK